MKTKKSSFEKFAVGFGDIFGSPQSFFFWITLLVIWIIAGPLMHFSDSWQLYANTPTTWIELFAAIAIQYVGNRIERRQEEHEARMIELLEEIRSLSELVVANLEQPAQSAEQPAKFQL